MNVAVYARPHGGDALVQRPPVRVREGSKGPVRRVSGVDQNALLTKSHEFLCSGHSPMGDCRPASDAATAGCRTPVG